MIPDPLGLLIYVIAAMGLAYVLGHSVISVRPRTWLAEFVLFKWPGYRCAPEAVGGCGGIFKIEDWARSGENFVCPCGVHQEEPEKYTRDTRPFEFFIDLLECPACLGFHLGWIFGAFVGPLWRPTGNTVVDILFWAFFTSGSNMLLGKATKLME